MFGRSPIALLAGLAALASACSSSSTNQRPDSGTIVVTAHFATAPSRVHATNVYLVAANDASTRVGRIEGVRAGAGPRESVVRLVLDPRARISRSVRAILCAKALDLFGDDHPPYLGDGDVLPLAVTHVNAGPCHIG